MTEISSFQSVKIARVTWIVLRVLTGNTKFAVSMEYCFLLRNSEKKFTPEQIQLDFFRKTGDTQRNT